MSAAEARFDVLWTSFAPRVYAYARRHVGPDAAQDVLSETFLVAWRRLDVVPDDPLPWLLVVARNVMANRRRSVASARAVEAAVARMTELVELAPAADVPALLRADVAQGLAALSEQDREALLLVAWDGLDGASAARVAGCSVDAFYRRLSRARARLTRALEPDDACVQGGQA